ncbi:ATP binding protein, putative [Ricinus communis]|uniref:ATP binding protein, putative n=1 Tax=Ricinus communis TaxID=3988 RepID=B9SJC0_RICCO|nr:ATP binding protein, putative [Ricinus communis]|eukprot:XP_002526089.1 uncharacterized protein LOC8285043 [Ricinus communis]
MIHKRPFVDDDSYVVARKHSKHLEHIDQLTPILPLDDAYSKPMIPDGEDSFNKCQDFGRSGSDPVISVSNEGNNLENGASGSFPHFLWINNGILEADNLSLFPEYFDHGHQLRALFQPDEAFSCLDYPFRKPVSIGPEHQVFVPDWEGVSNTSSNQLDKSNPKVALAQSSSSSIIVDDGYEERLMGTCIIPLPEQEVPASHSSESTITNCSCLDQGSIDCVKKHIMEARLKLRENLGKDIFEGLGFYDMGECVAKNWTEEEEQIFHDIVLANPASLGRNFWDHLSVALPSRTKRELVSYYFNVFMLRKRFEQNRFDPVNIDSDNDEWQTSDAGVAEEDEDSAVESLNGREATAYYEDHVDDCNEHVEDEDEIGASKESADDDTQRVATDEEYEGDLDDVSAAHVGVSTVGCVRDKGFKLFKGISCSNGNDCDIEDDSCTSYEYQRETIDCGGALDIETDGRHSSRE